MHREDTATKSRRAFLGGMAAMAAAALAPEAIAAPTILRGAGDVRAISILNPRTGDAINSVYWVDGQYIPEVLRDINHLMRDWRTDEVKPIDPGLLDFAAATYRLLNTSEPYTLYSGFRSRRTNQMLASRSRAVARESYHVHGRAADLHLESRSVGQIAAAALRLGAGGVGRYSRSNFVHLDTGAVRDWGR